MRKWTLPISLLGLGGLGVVIVSRHRQKRGLNEPSSESAGRMITWNGAAKSELQRIQHALQQLEQSLESAHCRH